MRQSRLCKQQVSVGSIDSRISFGVMRRTRYIQIQSDEAVKKNQLTFQISIESELVGFFCETATNN